MPVPNGFWALGRMACPTRGFYPARGLLNAGGLRSEFFWEGIPESDADPQSVLELSPLSATTPREGSFHEGPGIAAPDLEELETAGEIQELVPDGVRVFPQLDRSPPAP